MVGISDIVDQNTTEHVSYILIGNKIYYRKVDL